MHELLSLHQRVRRTRRRLSEFEPWIVREVRALGPWTFDGAPIALGAGWPEQKGVHRFGGGVFDCPWPLAEARLALDVGGESLLTIAYAVGARVTLGLDLNHNEFPLEGPTGALEIEAVARRAFGQYALPLPWPESNTLLLVPSNVATFAEDWSLPLQEVQLWVCLRELTMHAVMSRPGVRSTLAPGGARRKPGSARNRRCRECREEGVTFVNHELAQRGGGRQESFFRHIHDEPSAHDRKAHDIKGGQATVGKQAFATLWNPLARQYGLTTYQRTQL